MNQAQLATLIVEDSSKSRLSAAGRTGTITSVLLTLPFPDGTTLLSPENKRFLATIEAVLAIELERRRDGEGAFCNSTALEPAREYRRLITWMKLRGIEKFQDLTFLEIRRYLHGFCFGLDYHLQCTTRFSEYLNAARNSHAFSAIEADSLAHHMMACGIPKEYLRSLPSVRTLFQKTIENLPITESETKSQKQTLAVATIYTHAFDIEKLWLYRDKLPDALRFNPLPETPHLFAKKHGKQGGHTRTIPPELGAFFLARSVHWVMEVGPELLKVIRAQENREATFPHRLLEDTEECKHFNKLARKWGWKHPLIGLARSGRIGIELRSAKKTYLLTSCFVVIVGFTARRGIEAGGLKCNCISGDREHGFWLESYIGKRDIIDKTPCPEIVVHAVKMIIAMYGRNENSSEPLFRLRENTQKLSGCTPENINEFAKFVGADKTPNMADAWSYAQHQFRRLYAIIYVWRYEFPCLASLQHHLRHLYLWMTRTYYHDRWLEQDVLDESRKLTASKLKDIVRGEVKPVGILGKSLERALARSGSVHLVDEDRLDKTLDDFAKRRKLLLKATPWGYCGCSSSPAHLRRSDCHNRQGSLKPMEPYLGGPEGHASSEELCAGCIFHMTDAGREAHWRAVEEQLKPAADASKDSLLGEAIRRRLKTVSSFIRKNFGDSEEMQ